MTWEPQIPTSIQGALPVCALLGAERFNTTEVLSSTNRECFKRPHTYCNDSLASYNSLGCKSLLYYPYAAKSQATWLYLVELFSVHKEGTRKELLLLLMSPQEVLNIVCYEAAETLNALHSSTMTGYTVQYLLC